MVQRCNVYLVHSLSEACCSWTGWIILNLWRWRRTWSPSIRFAHNRAQPQGGTKGKDFKWRCETKCPDLTSSPAGFGDGCVLWCLIPQRASAVGLITLIISNKNTGHWINSYAWQRNIWAYRGRTVGFSLQTMLKVHSLPRIPFLRNSQEIFS